MVSSSIRFAATLLIVGAAFGASGERSMPVKPVDGVRIMEVVPGSLVAGTEQEVSVRIRYELNSLEQASLGLSFNTTDSARYRHFAKALVLKGTGEVVLSARVVPREWGQYVFFQAGASLVENVPPPPPPPPGERPASPRPAGRPALAVDHMPIPLTPAK